MRAEDRGIFLLQPDETLVRMDVQPYEAEDLLQKLLAEYPDLLAGDQIDIESPRRWLLIGREIGVPFEDGGSDWWSLDHLFLDQDAIPTFVEVKRASDTRARREVVAQMLDYAANATSYWPTGRMRELYERSCIDIGVEAEDRFREVFEDGFEAEAFWSLADENLRTGRVRLLFVSDRIPPELRRIVEFLNDQMSPAEVLALEVKQYIGGESGGLHRTLVPRITGQQVRLKAEKGARRPTRSLPYVAPDEFPGLLDPVYRDTFEKVVDIGRSIGYMITVTAGPYNRLLRFDVPGVPGTPVSIVENGTLWISFGRHHQELRDHETMERLRYEMGHAFPMKRENFLKRSEVGIMLDFGKDPNVLATVQDAFEAIYSILMNASDTKSPAEFER